MQEKYPFFSCESSLKLFCPFIAKHGHWLRMPFKISSYLMFCTSSGQFKGNVGCICWKVAKRKLLIFIPEFPESIVSNSEGFDEKIDANRRGGGRGIVNFYDGILRVWEDNAIWKFRRQGEEGGLKYGSHPWYNWYGYFLEWPIFRHIQNLTTFFSFY